MGNYSVVASNRHRQSASVSLETIVHQSVGRTESCHLFGILLSFSYLFSVALCLGLCFQLSSLTLCSSFASSLLCAFLSLCSFTLSSFCQSPCVSSFLCRCFAFSFFFCSTSFCFRQSSLACFLFESCLTSLCLCDSSCILSCSSLCSSFLASQFGSSTSCSLCSSSFAFSFCLCTLARLFYFYSYQSIDLSVQCSILLALVSYDAYDSLLLFLQSVYHSLLLGLLIL